MARQRVQLANFANWTGGLNLSSDPASIGADDSPNLINFDISQEGGLRPRLVSAPWAVNPAVKPRALVPFETPAISDCLVADGKGAVWSHAAAANIATGTRPAGDKPVRHVVANDKAYLQNGTILPWRWDGSTGTNLADAAPSNWNDNLAAPAGGRGVTAFVTTYHQGSIWVGNTTENSTAYRNRIRWSHPGNVEDWRTNDYIDVETTDSDHITAMIPLGRLLIVFKQHSMYAVGGSFNSFTVTPISRAVGAISAEAVALSDQGIYFWHQGEGIYFFDGSQLHHVFHKLAPAITDGRIVDTDSNELAVAWLNRKLFVGVPWAATPTVGRAFVYTPYIGHGAWTSYEYARAHTCYGCWRKFDGSVEYLAASRHTNGVLDIELPGVADGGGTSMRAVADTPWITLGAPGVVKRWKHVEAIVRADQDYTLYFDLRRDWDPAVARQFTVDVTGDFPAAGTTTLVWDDVASNWNTDSWSGNQQTLATDERVIVVRGPTLGSARSVSLSISIPATTSMPLFALDGLILKYIPKRVRS